MEPSLILPPFDDGVIDSVAALSARVFEETDPDPIRWRLTNMPQASLFVMAADGRWIAFKAGYALSEKKYYSWLGGVDPAYRRQGVAAALMQRQHDWLRTQGYELVETATNQNNHAMARVNLEHGFSICGMRTYPTATQILFLKQLE